MTVSYCLLTYNLFLQGLVGFPGCFFSFWGTLPFPCDWWMVMWMRSRFRSIDALLWIKHSLCVKVLSLCGWCLVIRMRSWIGSMKLTDGWSEGNENLCLKDAGFFDRDLCFRWSPVVSISFSGMLKAVGPLTRVFPRRWRSQHVVYGASSIRACDFMGLGSSWFS